MNSSNAGICFGMCGDGLHVAFDGEATRHASHAADRLICDYLTANHGSAKIVLDLGAVSYMDSTFAGWMLKLRRKMSELAGGSLSMSDCSERCQRVLDGMQIASLIQRQDVPRPEKTSRVACRAGDLPERALLELMASAHEELASLDEQSRRVFGPIAEALRKGLQEEDRRSPSH
ncbi:MAG: STAS domain-containing protein [Phycisphaerae bacterium]